MEVERQLGFEPTDREFEKLGYDIESVNTGVKVHRRIAVKIHQAEEEGSVVWSLAGGERGG
jgi:hypothetical protein